MAALHRLTDANGNITTWQRDIQGRVEKTYNDGQGTLLRQRSRRLINQIDAKGQSTDHRYALIINWRKRTTPIASCPRQR